jgi:mRNA interferase HicA
VSSANGNPDRFSEGMVIVRVADEVNQALTGHPGCRYESPPQPQEQALALVEVLLGHTGGSLNGTGHWTCPIAGGRRAITLRKEAGVSTQRSTVSGVSDTLELTIVYEPGENGWVIASIPEVRGVHSQGRTREQARANVLDALQLMLSPEPGDPRDSRERETASLHAGRVKRRDLERHLRAHGCQLIDEGANHTRWGGPEASRSVMPRHREIDFRLARKICKDPKVPPPSGAR